MKSRLDGIEDWLACAHAAQYRSQKLARLCRVSLRRLEQYFRMVFHRSPQDWLNEARLNAAQELLLTDKAVKEVAFELGFSSASHFIREFKRYHGCTPSSFRLKAVIERKAETGGRKHWKTTKSPRRS